MERRKKWLETMAKSSLLVLTYIVLMVFVSTKVSAFDVHQIKLSSQSIYVTKAQEISVSVKVDSTTKLSNLIWTYDNKSFSESKKWSASKYNFTGKQYVQFTKAPAIRNGILTAKIKFDLPFGTDNMYDFDNFSQFPFDKLLGNHSILIRDKKTGLLGKTSLNVMLYPNHYEYKDFASYLGDVKKNAVNGRYMEVSSLGKSSDNNHEQYFVVVAKDKASVDSYLQRVTEMYTSPEELLKKTQDKSESFKTAIWFNNVHPDETTGIDANLKLIKDLATKGKIKYDLKKADDSVDFPKSAELIVDNVLDNNILLFNITANPYGSDNKMRRNVNGFNLNGDFLYQTQTESANFAKAFSKWMPTTLLDFHGFLPQLLIEPCSAPHNPNYEYDLLIDGLLGDANAIGKVAVANTKYKSADIPYFDYKNSFDDYTTVLNSTLKSPQTAC